MKIIPDAMRRPAEVERDELRRRLQALEEREAACCPEDVPFDECIRALGEQLARARAEIEALMFLVKNQRCCRNCGNHASWNFDTCGFGENPTDPEEGPHCRRNNLSRWRPMEYRRAKAALAAERGE